jgi:amino acid adenylation domain-containing protein
MKRLIPLTPMQEMMFAAALSDNSKYVTQLLYGIHNTPRFDLSARFDELINRHEILRTAFTVEGGEPFMNVTDKPNAELIFCDNLPDTSFALNPLNDEKLIRIYLSENELLFVFSHILLDGWSAALILRELFGETPPQGKANPFRYYLKWLSSKGKPKTENAEIQQAILPFFAETSEYERAEISFVLSETEQIKAAAQALGVPLGRFIEAVWGVLSYRYGGDFIAAVDSGRFAPVPGITSIAGMFVSTVSLALKIDENSVFSEWVKSFSNSASEQIKRVSAPPSEKLCSLISVEFAELSQNADFTLLSSNAKLITDFDFVVILGEKITCRFEYNKRAFSEFAVREIHNHFIGILNTVLQNPNTVISEIDFLTDRAKSFIFRSSEDAELLHHSLIPLTEKIDKIAQNYPEKIAVVDGEKQCTYNEIKTLSEAIARHLIANKIRGGVMIKIPRSTAFLIAEIGVMKAGCYFIPIDPATPSARLDEIIKTIAPSFIIDIENYEIMCAFSDEKICDLPKITPDVPAYAIMTSGTTGAPKGVLVSHRSISHYISWAARTYKTAADTASALIYGFTFDGAFGSLYTQITSGGTVYILDEKTRFDIPKIAEFCYENKITHIDLPAAMIPEFTKQIANNTGEIRFIITGGEQLSPFTDCGIAVSNEYGPTEATVCVTQAFLNANEKIHIGNEIPNTKIFILDKNKKVCPLGVFGEVYIGGIQVAAGYIGDPENAAFMKNPFGAGRLYKTGDRARFIEVSDGFALEFAGRFDGQIKLNGFRIETGEIEAAARKFCGVINCVAAVRGAVLVLYAVCENSDNAEKVREKLREVLPSFMVPTVISVPEIPLKESGKPDLAKLSKYSITSREIADENQSPQSPNIKMLCDLIFETLGQNVSGADNFIRVGGNSISAMKISFALSERGFTLAPTDIIASENIEKLALKMTVGDKFSRNDDEFIPPNSLKSMIYLAEKFGNKIFTVTASKECNVSRENLSERIEKAVKLHDILRCRFSLDNQKNITAKITETPNIRLISGDEEFPRLIDPLGQTLVFVALSGNTLSIFYHHIVLDGFSINLLLSELADGIFPENAASYAAFANGFTDSVADTKYYDETLKNCEAAELFHSENAPEKLSLARYFDDNFIKEIEAAARRDNVTPAVFMMAAVGVFLCAFGGAKETYIPVIASFRNSGGLLGSAAQTFPVKFEPAGNSFKAAATRFRDELSNAVKHINIPENYLKLPYIFVDEKRDNALSDSQNYSLVITSGGAILYDEKAISENLLELIKTRLYSALKNAISGEISVLFDNEFKTLTEDFAIGKRVNFSADYLKEIHSKKALEIAEKLSNLGIGAGDLVAIEERRVGTAPDSYGGVSLSGAAFLPIDADLPKERKKEIIDDCKPAAYIRNGEISLLTGAKKHAAETAYVIYTSGTTGKPKGVPISKAALQSQINWTLAEFNFSEKDTILHFINFAFDPSVWVIFSAFASGANIEIVPENLRVSPDLIAEFITDKKITIAVLPAAAAYDIIDNLRENNLRLIFLGGDKIHIPKRTKYTENIEIVNLYGPTETCINATFFRLPNDIQNTANIGKPIAGTNIFILDKNKNPSPIGIRGEIYIGGDKLSKGYINRPTETENAFLTLPNFGRVYKTGDIAAWNSDGTIEFFGRGDRQVKIRGFRVELSEIEAAIFEITAAPVAVIYENGMLAAFLESGLSEGQILKKLRLKLPAYMIPNRVISIKKLPKNANGKIDFKALKIPTEANDAIEKMPMNETEVIIAKAFEDVLSLPAGTVTRNSDFFNLGGHSLKLFSLTGVLAARGICPGINDILENPTVSKLAEIARKSSGALLKSQTNAFSETDYDNFVSACEKVDLSKPRKADSVMITGVTGFLGAHILREVLRETKARIFLPIRGKAGRVNDVLAYYFPGEIFDFSRLVIFTNDISQSPPDLDEKIDIIYHSAADIRHYAPYDESYRSNVTATEHIITFAQKNGAYLAHISTASAVNKAVISENNFDSGADFENVYQHTKQIAERLLMNTENLQYGIFRVGNVTPSKEYRIKAQNADTNAYLNLLKLLIKSRSLPDFRGRSGYCFADETAMAIVLLAGREIQNRNIFHITNPNVLTFRKIFAIMNITEIANNDNLPDELRGIYAQRAVEKKTDVSADIKNDATLTLLRRLGFEWSAPDLDYLRAFTEYE